MENIASNKLLKYLDRVNGDFRPITADVFLTNYCNNKCLYCTYARWELDAGAVGMSFEDFKKYADKLIDLGVQGIVLTGGGEPTINKDFDLITRYLEDKQIHYGINTNFNRLRYFKPDYLKVSLDAYDEESYFKNRGVRAYEKTKKNIAAYIEWKKEHSPKTTVGIQKVVSDPDEILRFYDANGDLDVDYIVYRPIESTGGKYYTEKNASDVVEAVKLIKMLRETDERVILNYKWDYLSKRFDKCSAHWSQIALDEKGNVIYCCHKPYEIVGHILDDNILKKYSDAHTNMKMCDVPCRLTAPNNVFDELKKTVVNSQFI